jgi:hypothetical protein
MEVDREKWQSSIVGGLKCIAAPSAGGEEV